jgi:hypothetical protein
MAGKTHIGHAPTNLAAHGGEGGIKRLADGQPFTSVALEKQREVEAELAEAGISEIVERAAVRLQTVSDLFYNAVMAAGERGDFDTLDKYSQRFGWLQSKALLAWQQVRANRKASGAAIDGVLRDYGNEPGE